MSTSNGSDRVSPDRVSPDRVSPDRVSPDRVAILIVTHNEAADLPACFDSIRAQTHRELEVVVVDCASQDDSLIVSRGADLGPIPIRVIDTGANLGFAGGMNTALAHTDAPFALSLNADVRLDPEYVERLLRALRAEDRTGAATGRLLRFAADDGLVAQDRTDGNRTGEDRVSQDRVSPDRIDACGMRLTRSWRHLDRGAGEVDRGQFSASERVFGATGAAALFSRAALDDVCWPRHLVDDTEPALPPSVPVFDPDFFTFREDAELAFRLQARGWQVVFEPQATARHRRNNLPERRRRMPALINYHGVKNRFLLRAYHQTARNALRTFVPTLWRDLMVIGYVLVAERDSLPAFAWLWRHRQRIRARRRFVQNRRSASVDMWFHTASQPLNGPRRDLRP